MSEVTSTYDSFKEATSLTLSVIHHCELVLLLLLFFHYIQNKVWKKHIHNVFVKKSPTEPQTTSVIESGKAWEDEEEQRGY
jgi:hypothetical protein